MRTEQAPNTSTTTHTHLLHPIARVFHIMDAQPVSSRLTALGSSLIPQPPSLAAAPAAQNKRDTSFYSDHVIFKVSALATVHMPRYRSILIS